MSDEYHNHAIQITRLEGRMETMERDMRAQNVQMASMSEKLDEVLTALHEAKGGWRTMLWIGGAFASTGAFIAWALSHLSVHA